MGTSVFILIIQCNARKCRTTLILGSDGMSNQYGGRDLTVGSIPGHLLMFSLPLLLGNLFQALYNTVDSIWVGRFIGSEALGAVSVSFPIIFALTAMVMGFTMAATVLVSQYAGARDEEMIKKTVSNSFLILGIAGIAVSLIGIVLSKQILIWIRTPQEVLDHAVEYLQYYSAGLFFMFGYNLLSSIMRGLGDSKTPLIFLIIATITNIILDPIFIRGLWFIPAMGIKGAAIATDISQGLSFFLALFYLNSQNHIAKIRVKELEYNGDLTLKMLKIGLPTGIQQTIVSFGLVVMTSVINSFGTATVAAFGAASRLDQFAHMPAMSMGLAVSSLTGQNIGAQKKERVHEVYKWGCIFTGAIAALIALFALVCPQLLLKLFTDETPVLQIGSRYLRIVGLSYIPFSLMFITNGILRGAGDTFPTLVFSVVSLWLVRIPLARYLSAIGSLGSDGIWMAIAISSLLSMLMSQVYYATGRWKRITLTKEPQDSSDKK
jgi:putative MATE family efflux protein